MHSVTMMSLSYSVQVVVYRGSAHRSLKKPDGPWSHRKLLSCLSQVNVQCSDAVLYLNREWQMNLVRSWERLSTHRCSFSAHSPHRRWHNKPNVILWERKTVVCRVSVPGVSVCGLISAPGQVSRKEKSCGFDFALATNRHDGSRAQHGHPCAGDPGRGSGFDQVVACSWEGASVGPWDPWGGTSEARNLTEETRRRACSMEQLI